MHVPKILRDQPIAGLHYYADQDAIYRHWLAKVARLVYRIKTARQAGDYITADKRRNRLKLIGIDVEIAKHRISFYRIGDPMIYHVTE